MVVEDNPGDVRLIREALADSKILNKMDVAVDGEQALASLQSAERLPDLILLDLNLPRMDGQEVLRQIKADDRTKRIPVVVLTSSRSEEDIARSYGHHANCYVSKPLGLQQFAEAVQSVERFWFSIVTLPAEADAIEE